MIFFGLKIYKDSDSFNLRCVISKVDGNTYCVRERSKLELAADLLAEATSNMKKLVKYVEQKHSSNPAVKRLVENFNPDKISETLPTSEHTAYSENKGEKMAFCLNEDKQGTRLIDLSTLTFVAIHELAHLMTESIGHKEEYMNPLTIQNRRCNTAERALMKIHFINNEIFLKSFQEYYNFYFCPILDGLYECRINNNIYPHHDMIRFLHNNSKRKNQ